MPKVRNTQNIRKADQKEQNIEEYASRCNDITDKLKHKILSSRISVAFSQEEIEKLKSLANKDKRSLSAFVRLRLLKLIGDVD